MPNCPDCNAEVPAWEEFCPKCRAKIKSRPEAGTSKDAAKPKPSGIKRLFGRGK